MKLSLQHSGLQLIRVLQGFSAASKKNRILHGSARIPEGLFMCSAIRVLCARRSIRFYEWEILACIGASYLEFMGSYKQSCK